MSEKIRKKRCFLGGTCNNSDWREHLIPLLKIDYFNPVVKDWTPECQEREIKEREECDYVLYVITPNMTGVYSIAEVVDDSNKRPQKTVFCVLQTDTDAMGYALEFGKVQAKSLLSVKKMVAANGVKVCENLNEVADFVNNS